jgi:O-antigen/teichoic acid export membrane protein
MATNVLFSLLSFGSSLIIAFFLSPYILHQLGDGKYGVWAMFGEVLTYYGLFDLGIRGAVNYYVGRALAAQREDQLKSYVSSAFFGLVVLSSFAFAFGVGLILYFQDVIVAGTDNRFEVVTAAILFALLFCVGMPIEVFSAVLAGSRRLHLVSSSEIAARCVSAVLMYLGLRFAPGLLVLWFAQFGSRLLYWALIRRYVLRYEPEARVAFSLARLDSFRELLSYGSKNAFLNVSWLLMGRKDATLITIFHGPMLVATYSFARIIVQSVHQACAAMTTALRPNLVYHWARNEFEQAYTIYYTGVRYSSFMVTSAAAFLIVFGKEFLALWIGTRFVTGPTLFRTDIVLYILIASQLPRTMHSMSWQLLFAADKQKQLVWLVACEAVANVSLAIVLVQRWGVAGIAVASLVPSTVSCLFVLPFLLSRLVGIELMRYFREGVGRPLLSSVCLVALGFALKHYFHPANWTGMIGVACIFGIAAVLLGLVFVIRPDDRTVLIRKAQALMGRISSASPGAVSSR